MLQQFSAYLADRWNGPFNHAYAISRSAHWGRWRELARQQGVTHERWSCDSLSQAEARYSWGRPADAQIFEDLSHELREVVAAGNTPRAAELCREIFEWGGVARKSNDLSQLWVTRRAADGTLCDRLQQAATLLRPQSVEPLHRFNGSDLPINSAMTKVYAAVDPVQQVIIYDGRVGAAFGLLVRRFLEEMQAPQLPPQLAFPWGRASSVAAAARGSRDPSCALYQFGELRVGNARADVNLYRARWTRTAGNVLLLAQQQLQPVEVPLRMLEKALFMIGYDVKLD